jgi:hypothetical protein
VTVPSGRSETPRASAGDGSRRGPFAAGLQPTAGRFDVDDDGVWFIPRFPFIAGTSYSLLVQTDEHHAVGPELWTIERPARVGAPTTDVVEIYPSADVVPLNLLKLYVHFSAPMSEGWALRAVRVRRADTGAQLEGVFLPMEPELWDPGHRRLTLLLDPGRIKRGLVPHEEAGYPLVEGVPIVVSIDLEFRDAAGRPLRAAFERRYEVGPAVRTRVDPAHWEWETPAAGAVDPLVVAFDRPLDQALLEHCLEVFDGSGAPVPGQHVTGRSERTWRFEPESPWRAGPYALRVDPVLEDLAGNSVVRVFDRDLLRDEDAPRHAGPWRLEFACRPSPGYVHYPNLAK